MKQITNKHDFSLSQLLTLILLAGDHPVPSIEVSLKILIVMMNQSKVKVQAMKYLVSYLKHTSPLSLMLGCHILVSHFTLGGCNKIIIFNKELSGSAVCGEFIEEMHAQTCLGTLLL